MALLACEVPVLFHSVVSSSNFTVVKSVLMALGADILIARLLFRLVLKNERHSFLMNAFLISPSILIDRITSTQIARSQENVSSCRRFGKAFKVTNRRKFFYHAAHFYNNFNHRMHKRVFWLYFLVLFFWLNLFSNNIRKFETTSSIGTFEIHFYKLLLLAYAHSRINIILLIFSFIFLWQVKFDFII